MAAQPPEERRALAMKASMAAAGREHTSEHRDRLAKHGPGWPVVYSRMSGARVRCTQPTAVGYASYGGRGIRFLFLSLFEATVWVIDNLGPPPSGTSIDRIDNSGHYAPGNLRWATRSEQGQNKRAYKRSLVGNRVRDLKNVRPDLTEETIRQWIRKGFSDDEITNRRKHIGCGVRHTELRPAE
jgi:hypothetical protein